MLVGAPLARQIYRLGIWTSTLGQDPPGKEKMDARLNAPGKKPFFERVRPYSPPGLLERRGRPVSLAVRVVWFVLVGWWLGVVWVVISWSPFLLPYFFVVRVPAGLLSEVPSVMTLAWPASVAWALDQHASEHSRSRLLELDQPGTQRLRCPLLLGLQPQDLLQRRLSARVCERLRSPSGVFGRGTRWRGSREKVAKSATPTVSMSWSRRSGRPGVTGYLSP